MERDKMIESVIDCIDGFDHKAFYSDFDVEKCAKKIISNLFPDGSVVMTKEELVKTMESGYVYDTTKGNKINLIDMAQEQARNETKREVLKKLDGFRFVMYDDEDEEFEVASWTCGEDDVKRFAKEIGVEEE